MYKLFWYPKCSTCKKAKNYLEQQQVKYELVDLVTSPPTANELKTWIEQSDLPVRRFFNTSGIRYREQGLKDKVTDFSIEEASVLLSSDGMLIKRPILVRDNQFLTNGFKESDYEGAINK